METLPAIPVLVPIPTTMEESQSSSLKREIIFRSRLPDIDIPSHLPLHSYIFENISKFSERPCLIEGATGKVYTYADVEVASRKFASRLSKLGISHGDTIMLLLPNMVEFVFAFFGASYLGAISTMANPLFTSAQIIKQAKDSNAKIIITLGCHVDKVREFAFENEVKVLCIDTAPEGCLHLPELIHGDDNEFSPEVKISPEDVVALPYTSGTTGIPKGVMLTHKVFVTNVANQVDGENANIYMHNEDVLMCVMPLYHMFALNSILLCGLRVGAAVLIMQKFEIVPFLEMIEKYKVTVGSFVPPVMLAIAKSDEVDKYDLSSVRMIMVGAAPLGKELEDSVRAKLPNAILGQGYGMTEGGPVMAMSLGLAKEPFKIKSGACGTVVRNAEMKIVDVHTGESLPRNQRGEVCMRGDSIMKGYLNNPEATARAIDKEGWLHSGDIGFIDDDDELFIVDRMIELINYKGFHVAPAELEALLLTHPNISDAAVVSMVDEDAGEVPVAFVVITNGSTITEDEIKHFISKQVVFYKRISRVFFVDVIPKVASGKILRRDLRERLTAMIPH